MRASENQLPTRVTDEQVIEQPQTKMALDKQFVSRFLATAEPSVLNLERFKASGTVLNVTYFNKGQDGQRIIILGDGTTTIVHDPTRIITNTAANKLLAVDKVYRFTRYDGVWVEDDGGSGGGGGGGGISLVTAQAIKKDANFNVTSATYAVIDAALDLTLAAVADDVLSISVGGLWDTGTASARLDVGTLVAGSIVNYVSTTGAGGTGIQSCRALPTSTFVPFSGTILYTVQAGDLSGGNVVLRLLSKVPSGSRQILINANEILYFNAVNLKQ